MPIRFEKVLDNLSLIGNRQLGVSGQFCFFSGDLSIKVTEGGGYKLVPGNNQYRSLILRKQQSTFPHIHGRYLGLDSTTLNQLKVKLT